MTEARWAIRFYVPFDSNNTLSIVGAYDNAGGRYLDDVVVFSGIYGVPDHMLWYIHKDLISYNFAGYSMELRLFLGGDPESPYFEERYRVISVGDDFATDRKLLYAISEDYAKLGTLLIGAEVATLEYKETRTPEEALREVLESNGIFGVVFCEHKDKNKKSVQFEYNKLTLDPSWTVGDFIRYIADENNFEWTIKYGLLFIGPELYTYKKLNASKDIIDRTVDNISRTYHCVKIAWNGTPLNVLWYYEQATEEKVTPMRCIWVKHFVGSAGDVTKGCFYPIGRKIDKQLYFETLEGKVEKANALSQLFKVVHHNQVKIVRIIKDEGENEYVDEITLEKDIDEFAKKTPRNMVLNIDEAIYTLPKVGKTTPYLDYKSGLLFPRSHVLPGENSEANNPNRLLFSPYDRLEQSVLGPFVMGNGSEDFKKNIPKKDPDDLRLQLPNGLCFYIKQDGTMILQLREVDNKEIPIDIDQDKEGIIFEPSIEGSTAQHRIKLDDDNFISIQNKTYGVKVWSDGLVAVYGEKGILLTIAPAETFIDINASTGDIEAQSKEGKIIITSLSDNVEINCGSAKEVIVNSGTNSVSLIGHTHDYTHTHQVPVGPAIPGPPANTIPQSTTDTVGEADKHSKHLKAVKA